MIYYEIDSFFNSYIDEGKKEKGINCRHFGYHFDNYHFNYLF